MHRHAATSHGARISFRESGSADSQTIVLLHGGAAHSGWWDDVVPLLSRWHVVLPDLSGHGDSDHREAYDSQTWADDVAAVVRAAAGGSPVAVVGHSMGGVIGIATAARHPDLVASAILVDSRLPLRGLEPPSRTVRLFSSADEALDRFRLLPAATRADRSVLRRIAADGLRETEGGWRWKFDPGSRRRLTNEQILRDLASVTCPVGYAWGELSDMGGPDSLRHLEDGLGRAVPHRVIAGAHHHVPLDEPAGCAAAIEDLLTLHALEV